jgi:hypothetical protein
MTCSIFVRSYRGDREWLRYCLRALRDRATGFLETVVCLPVGDEPHFEHFDYMGARVEWHHDIGADGYLGQQACKAHADEMCRGDHIMFVDSDTILTRVTEPKEFTFGGKPITLIRHWSEVGEAIMWRDVVHKALGFEPAFEGMACMPLVHDRRMFPLLRQYFQSVHGKSLRDYVKECAGRAFSEFNVFAAFAQRYTPHLYEWRMCDPGNDGYPRIFTQFWSWSGVDEHRNEIERILR